MSLVEIKSFNALIDNKSLSNNKNKKHMKNLLKYKEMMTIQQEICQDICITKNLTNLLAQIVQDKQIQEFQKISFVEKLEEGDGATMFFIAEKQQKNILIFRFINCNRII